MSDIACKDPPRNNRRVYQYDNVSRLVSGAGLDAFLVLGDEQYESGRYRDFEQNYNRYFGQVLDISYPVPGNHEYGTPDASGYLRSSAIEPTAPAGITRSISAPGTSSR